jgi:hypothetical protein
MLQHEENDPAGAEPFTFQVFQPRTFVGQSSTVNSATMPTVK